MRRHKRRRRARGGPAPAESTSRPRLVLALLLLAVFALKLVVMAQLKDHVLTQPDAGLDTTTYAALAGRVLGGDLTLGPGLYFVSPLYIYFLAAVLLLTKSFTAVRLLQIVLGTCSVGLVYLAANEWFGRRAGWFAAGLAALTGLFTFYESLLIQSALDPCLTAAAMALLAVGLKRGGWRSFALAGALFGAQVLNRPNVAIPAGAIVLLLASAQRWRQSAAVAAGMMIALAPATMRNAAVAGSWSPLSSQGGLNFYIGNNPDADGTYRTVAGITPNIEGQRQDARRVAERAVGHTLDDPSVSAYFYTQGITWIRTHPAAAARLFLRKIAFVFSAESIWLNYSFRFFADDGSVLLRALVVGPWLLVPLGLLGLVIAAPNADRREYGIWASFVPIYAIAVALFFVADRYTLPLLVPLCAAAGAALDAGLLALAARRWMPLAFGALVTVGLAVLVMWPLHLDDGVAEERTRMAERLVTLGRYQEADVWASRAEQGNPRPGIIHFRVGQRLLLSGQPSSAVAHFEKALTFDAGQPEVEFALGETLLNEHHPKESIPHLRRALDAAVRPDQAGYDLVRALAATGDLVQAAAVLKNVRPENNADGEGWTALGDLAMQLEQPLQAETFFRRALAVRPDLASAHVGLAAADATMGWVAEARVHVGEALRLDPSSERAKQLQELLK